MSARLRDQVEGNLVSNSIADNTPAPYPVSIKHLTLTNFRCYSSVRLEIGSRSVVLTGPNGAGKTNILESVSFLSPGRGIRQARLSEVTRRGSREEDANDRIWAVAAKVILPDGDEDIGTGLLRPGVEKRTIRVGGQTARSQGELSKYLDIQWLTPQMDGLFRDGKSARRRFLDRLVYGYDPTHASRINAYEHAMRERTRLLRGGMADDSWLSSLEDVMAAKGVAVAAARNELVDRLGRFCQSPHGCFPSAALTIDGEVEHWLMRVSALEAEDNLRLALADSREQDGAIGGARIGPHKSDLLVRHIDKDQSAIFCSTGEQKALLISIVLADARMASIERRRIPILLLDEVVAHLDETRREYLFNELSAIGGQVWLSGTDLTLFEPFSDNALFFSVADAIVTPGIKAV